MFDVENLTKTSQEAFHLQRMITHHVKTGSEEVMNALFVQAELLGQPEQVVKNLDDIRIWDGKYEILPSCEGLHDVGDQTWEHLEHLQSTLPEQVKNVPQSYKNRATKSRIMDLYF